VPNYLNPVLGYTHWGKEWTKEFGKRKKGLREQLKLSLIVVISVESLYSAFNVTLQSQIIKLNCFVGMATKT